MRCLVTGASGFVGSNLALELDNQGNDVIAVGARGEQQLDGFSGTLIAMPFYQLDWKKIGKVDALFHQAAITGMVSPKGEVYKDKEEFIFVNADSSIKLFEEAIKRGCKKIVYASSTAVYGDTPSPYVEGKNEVPNSFYGESKLLLDEKAMELAEKNPDVKIVGLRYCNIYGPRENHKGKSANVVYQFAQQILKGNPRAFKHGEQRRDEIYIKDVVRANFCALDAKKSCVVNCGTGKPISFNEMIKSLNKVMGFNREIEYINNPFPFFQNYTECDMTKANEMIGFVPEWDFHSGIEDYHKSGWLTKKPV
jgi:ADP-L-glycero-D-manno-heptose 6-epimerase